MNKKLFEAFNIKKEEFSHETVDYLVFKDKDLLDHFRLLILEDIGDKGYENGDVSSEAINEEINEITEGYDLDPSERNYLYNLIDNEVNGYGPLTELLRDDNISEIMVNNPRDVYIEIDGNLKKR